MTTTADSPFALAVELAGLTPTDAGRITEAIAANCAPHAACLAFPENVPAKLKDAVQVA